MPKQPRFLLDDELSGPGEYVLNRMESHHAASVLRLRAGDAMVVFDGMGKYADALVEKADREAMRVKVEAVSAEPHMPLILTIATAIPKGKRWQALVEKCTELGVDRIIPLHTERSVAKGEGDANRWRRWMIEAAKQSRRAWIPEIIEPVPVQDAIAIAVAEESLLLYADGQGDSPRAYKDLLEQNLRVMVFIGPEGGFTQTEMEVFRQAGASPLSLSHHILRVETAAVAVCALIRDALM